MIIEETRGKSLWKVQVVDSENGKPTGTFLDNIKSQMMRYPKDNEFPMANSDGSQEEEPPEEEAAKGMNISMEKESDRPKSKNKKKNQTVEKLTTSSVAKSASSANSDGSDATPKRSPTKSKKKTPLKTLAKKLKGKIKKKQKIPELVKLSSDSELSSDEGDPDQEEEEDVPFKPTATEQEGADFYSANDLLIAKGIEDEEKHKNKWAQYLVEKDALINEGWSMECKPPKKQTIDIGERGQRAPWPAALWYHPQSRRNRG